MVGEQDLEQTDAPVFVGQEEYKRRQYGWVTSTEGENKGMCPRYAGHGAKRPNKTVAALNCDKNRMQATF